MGSKSQEKVFLREATGLRKNVSFLDALSMNVGVMSAGPTLAVIGFTMILLPSVAGINLVWGSLISAILVIPLMMVYTMFGRRVSRTGGDYIWTSRAFGGLIGGPGAFTGFVVPTMAFSAFSILSAVFALGSLGLSLGQQNFFGIAVPGTVLGSDPTSQFLIGVGMFAVLIVANLASAKLGYRLVTIMTFFSILTIFLSIILIVSAGQSGIASYLSSLGNANVTYVKVASSYSGSPFNLGATLFLLPLFAIFVYPYLNNPPAVGSELQRGKAVRWNAPIAVLAVTIILTLALGAMYYGGGFGFTNAALSSPTLVNDFGFNFFTWAMGVSNSAALVWIIGLGWIISWLVVIQVNFLSQPRYLFAMAFDRFLPSRLAYVSPRFGTPVVGILVFSIPTIIIFGLATFLYGTVVALFGAIASTMIYFILLGLSAVVYGSTKEKGRAKALFMISGVLTAIIFVYIVYQFFAYQGIWGGNNLAYGVDITALVFAVAIYLASKVYHGRKGMDISMAYKEIPPE